MLWAKASGVAYCLLSGISGIKASGVQGPSVETGYAMPMVVKGATSAHRPHDLYIYDLSLASIIGILRTLRLLEARLAVQL